MDTKAVGPVQKETQKRGFFRQLITNRTGVSVKSFMLVWGAGIATIITITILGFEAYLMTHPEVKYRPNYIGIAGVITATGTMIAAIVWGKIKGESFELPGTNHDQHIE